MDGDRLTMSQRERDRLKVMSLVLQGKRTQAEAGRLLELTVRQIRRVQRRLEAEGDGGIIHRLRGRSSNRQHRPELREAVLRLYRQAYPDFGPTLAAEKLAAGGLAVGPETLRQWLLEAGLWQRHRRRAVHRSRRARRECFGELVQADGSHHDWLEGRGEAMVLVVLIDDASSQAQARFYPGETTVGYFDLLGRWLRKHGRMVSMYTDRDSIFWGEKKGQKASQTQFTRALGELGITWIPAYSPQAKGRVERFNATAQDRLVKELRLAGAQTIEQANAVLEQVFLPWFNRRCTIPPASANDAHRPCTGLNLAAILSIQETRHVANDYTFQLGQQVYQILPPPYPGLRGGRVTVERRLDGRLQVRFGPHYLKYRLAATPSPAGALPPDPRSLALWRTPAELKGEGGTRMPPSAVRPAAGRSGRTPAEPCPPHGEVNYSKPETWRPPADHPWRRFKLSRRRKKADISKLAK